MMTESNANAIGTLDHAQVSGNELGHDTPRARERRKDYETAKEAVSRADASELFVLYEKAIRDRNSMSEALGSVASHFIGSKDTPHFIPDDNAISAMERVALAAIELARFVANGIKE